MTLSFGLIFRIFKNFRKIFAFSPWQGERPTLAFGSKSKNLLEIFLNLLEDESKTQVINMFEKIEGHSLVKIYLEKALREAKVPQTLLFSGLEGIGKKKMAYALAAQLLNVSEAKLEEGNVLDFHFVFPESKSGQHTIEDLKEAMEHARETSFVAGNRVFVIEAADRMQAAAANALLKILEEPPNGSYWILLSSRAEEILPTICSRAIQLVFHPLSAEQVAKVLAQLGHKESYALYAHGSISKALELMKSPEVSEAHQIIFSLLSRFVPYPELAKKIEKIDELLEVEEPLAYRQRIDHLFSSIALYLRDQELRKIDPNSKLLFFPEEKESELNWKGWEERLEEARLGFERNIKLSNCLEPFFANQL